MFCYFYSIGPTSPYASKLNTAADEHLYLSSTTDFNNDTTIDKENTLRSQKNLATTLTNKDNRAFILKVYDNENDDTEDDTYLISLKSIEDSPYYFPSTKMSHTSDSMFVNYQPPDLNISEHFTQTRGVDYYDHSTNTDEGYEDGSSNPSRFDSIPREEIYLTPSKYRSVSRKPLSNIFPNTNINNQKQSDDYETLDFGDRIIIPTKYRLQQDRIKKLLNNENTYYPQEQSQTQIEKQRQPQNQNKLNQELPQQQQSQYDQRKQSRQRNGSESEILPQQQQFRKGTELEEEPLQQQSHYHPKQQYRQQNRLARESSPEQQGSNYHELDQLQKQSETVRESPSQQHQSPYQQRQQPRKRTKSEESLQQQQSQYHQQGQLKNQDTLVQNSFSTLPQQQQSQYHQRQPSRQQNESERESSPPPPQQQQQQQQPNYYEIDESQKRSGLVRESPPRQQQSQYHRQGQLQNQKTWEQNLSSTPPQQQQSQYHQRQQIGQQNESERESSPQQQQANYYEINQSEKQSRFVRESPPRQQQSRQRNELEQDSLYLSPYYDEIPQPRVEPDEEELQVQPHHHQQQRPMEIISQDSSKPIYNRYKVIAGDFELRESPYDNSSPMNASKLGQMQLVFKATLQGPEVQERAKNSISELVSNRSRTQSASNINKQNNLNKASYPNNPQSSTNVDSRNQNTTNIDSNRETEYQIGSNHNSRLNSISHTAQSPTTRIKPDHGNLSSATNYQSFETSSPPNKSIKRTIYDDHPSEIESHRQSNNQSPLPIQVIAANMTTHNANDNDLNGIYERSRSSSQNYTSSKYEKNPLREADNLHSSQLLSPPRSSPIPFQPKSKYYFGERVQNQLPDDEEDNEADCETFGHNSQPRSLTTTNTTRNLDDPYTTNSRFSMNDNNYPGNLQFGQQTDVGTATSTSLTQRQQNSSSANQSTLGKTRDSPRDSQISTTNKQIPYAYSVQTTQNAVNQVISNATSSTSGFQQQDQNESDHSEQNIGRNIKQEQSSSKSDRDRDDANQSQYEGDDDGRDNDNIDEYQDDDHDIHNQNDDEDRTYANNGDDEDDNVVKYDESDETTPRQSGVSELLTYNPVRDTSKDLLPMQYPIIDARLLPSASNISSTTQKNKKKGFFGFLTSSKTQDVNKSKMKPSKQKLKR